MAKTDKKSKDILKPTVKPKPLYAIAPWSCVHYPDRSEIEAYVEAAGDWEIIAEVRQTAHVAAEATANFIIRVVNDYEKTQHLINEMTAALENCLECEGLNWSAEHDAEVALRRAKQASE